MADEGPGLGSAMSSRSGWREESAGFRRPGREGAAAEASEEEPCDPFCETRARVPPGGRPGPAHRPRDPGSAAATSSSSNENDYNDPDDNKAELAEAMGLLAQELESARSKSLHSRHRARRRRLFGDSGTSGFLRVLCA